MTASEALALLRPCRELLLRIENSDRGIYYQPTDEDRPIIADVMRVCAAYPGYENETLHWLHQRAGLSPSGWALIREMIEEWTMGLPRATENRLEAPRQHADVLKKAPWRQGQ
jgi:hypothetical protein